MPHLKSNPLIGELRGKIGDLTITKCGGSWAYASTAAVPGGKAVVIEVTVADRAGNKTIKRVDHVCGVRN